MKNLWLKTGCFLTGYSYRLVMSCSEASKKAVKKYTSALLIIMIIWFLIGVLFSQEYIKLSFLGAVGAGLVLTVIIVQIERQIILGTKSWKSSAFRFVLGLVMAAIGSVIIDQIIFQEDIEKQKLLRVDKEVNEQLPYKVKEVDDQIAIFQKDLDKKEKERLELLDEISKKPTINMPVYATERIPTKVRRSVIINGVSTTREFDTILVKKKYESHAVENPKTKLIPILDKQIDTLRKRRAELSIQKSNIRKDLEQELLHKKGFLDELEVMFEILTSSPISLIVWSLWFLFFLIIELLVIVSKLLEKENDYDRIIKHQVEIKILSLEKLTE
ncbi:DUF4407 domain-containing protein [Pseudotenacibaculum haliotis]|uniref:DUF4407 domain-containing protein n=1 Tax=Pseudotenacibaculum haliotis TaxID=1862138 RepID=A0ABW5LW46_9FLAO